RPAAREFSGLKKGFLNGGGGSGGGGGKAGGGRKDKGGSEGTSAGLTVVRARPEAAAEALRFDEVQEAVRRQLSPLDRKEWLTEEFLAAVEANPILSRALADPAFAAAAGELARDGSGAAARRLAAARPDWTASLREFAGLLGDGLERLADKEDERAAAAVDEALPEHERRLVERVRADPELQ
ncbi:hypothetical protein HK405_000748, partial [Cladochytrium tenue]